jgi:hypothetical protein
MPEEPHYGSIEYFNFYRRASQEQGEIAGSRPKLMLIYTQIKVTRNKGTRWLSGFDTNH